MRDCARRPTEHRVRSSSWRQTRARTLHPSVPILSAPDGVTAFLNGFFDAVPLTLDPAAWYFGRSLSVLILSGLILYGFWSALGQKSAFGAAMLEEA